MQLKANSEGMKDLKNTPTLPSEEFHKHHCKDELEALKNQLYDLQNKYYADGRFGILIILQGMDSSGKDGITRHVLNSMNPMGVHVKSFKTPTEEEAKHDFLWRAYPHIPARGMIEVFNRSYYEDITIPYVNNQLTDNLFKHRCEVINTLEKHWELNNIHILKFYLHISSDEQKERIKERLTLPEKQWKYSEEDRKAANQWDIYASCYDNIFKHCNAVPWHIIPSDKRWYRNYAIAKIVTEHLEKLDLQFPKLTL